MMANNALYYSEIFCQAVQNIINGEVSKLQFDISRECTILNIIDRAYGQYQVSDGSLKFEAVAAEGATYEIGDRVIVQIPQGDSNKQINILNKIVDKWSGPAGFVRPLDTLSSCTGNIAFDAHGPYGLLTNDPEVAGRRLNILTLENQKYFGFQRVGISAKFKTLLDNRNIIKGDYGLEFILVNQDGAQESHLMSCSEMLGDPYGFNDYFQQEYAFNISDNFKRIRAFYVNFYQNGDFHDGNGNKLNCDYKNLFVKDLEVYLGYPTDRDISEIVEIMTEDSLEYDGSGNEERKIELHWIHKTDNYHLEQITQSILNEPSKFKVRWYQYEPGCDSDYIDEYGGRDWKQLKTYFNSFICNIDIRQLNEEERVKAVCLIDTRPLVNDQSYIQTLSYSSNIITFTNTKEAFGVDDNASISEIIERGLSLKFHDNSYGNYFLYDQNNRLIDATRNGETNPREIELLFNGKKIDENNQLNNIKSIEWEVPKGNDSMISYDSDWNTDKNSLIFKYSILSTLDLSRGNNIIKCTVNMGGKNYYLQEELRFGRKGTSGTYDTFILEMLDGKNALSIAEDDNGLRIKALLIKKDGKEHYFTTDEISKISWSLINKHDYIEYSEPGKEAQEPIITLTLKTKKVPTDNYTILEAAYKQETGPILKAYLPIPIKDPSCSHIEGTKQIIYDHQGNPKYSNNIYIGYIKDEPNYNNWAIQKNENNPNPVELIKSTDEKGVYLKPSPLYFRASDINNVIQDQVCVYLPDLWSQPILIMQSRYDFAMLNEWDGSLQINDGNNTIMATMLGAGRKNDDNTFSGVLMGDVKEGTNLESTNPLTGIYGFNHGVVRYALREDGTALFDSNGGRIELNNNGITINANSLQISGKGVPNSEEAYTYAENAAAIAQASAETYAKDVASKAEASAKSYTENEIAATKTSMEAYVNGEITGVKNIITAEDQAILTSINNLFTQEKILEELSGGSQGLYIGTDGKLYINAEYLKTGALSADTIGLTCIFQVFNGNNRSAWNSTLAKLRDREETAKKAGKDYYLYSYKQYNELEAQARAKGFSLEAEGIFTIPYGSGEVWRFIDVDENTNEGRRKADLINSLLIVGGYLGYKEGYTGTQKTNGVILAGPYTQIGERYYLIATDSGIRLQSPIESIEAYLTIEDGKGKFKLNNTDLMLGDDNTSMKLDQYVNNLIDQRLKELNLIS